LDANSTSAHTGPRHTPLLGSFANGCKEIPSHAHACERPTMGANIGISPIEFWQAGAYADIEMVCCSSWWRHRTAAFHRRTLNEIRGPR
jgi:hypothetical protein